MTASGMIDECIISSKPFSKTDADGRPITSAIKGKSLTTFDTHFKDITKITENDSNTSSILSLNDAQSKKKGFKCKNLVITILSNWGDDQFVGICELELIGQKFKKIPVNLKNLTAKPRDINEIDKGKDKRTLDKLINGHYKTCD